MMTYLIISYFIYAGLLTGLASALHGGNYFKKAYIVAAHVILLPTIAPFFWFFFRRAKQADAELNFMAGKGDLVAVRKAYPLGLGRFIAPVIAWATRTKWTHSGGADPLRIQQELAGGCVSGWIICIPTIMLIAAIVNQLLAERLGAYARISPLF